MAVKYLLTFIGYFDKCFDIVWLSAVLSVCHTVNCVSSFRPGLGLTY